MEYTLGKKCERCGVAIPDSYGNLLCDIHYEAYTIETEAKRKEMEEQAKTELLKNVEATTHPTKVAEVVPTTEPALEASFEPSSTMPTECDHSTCGISDPNYKENPEADDKEQVLANLAQFVASGKMLWYSQRNIYTFLKNYCMKTSMSHPQYPKYLWKPKIVDVGCGSGVGSNVLSIEADMVWGIDKNVTSVKFAKECFTREKNGEYYSSQLTFDVIDIMHDTRQFMAFDIVVAIEIIEHVWDINGFLESIIRFTKRDKTGAAIKDHGTEFFISTPNRNSPKIQKDKPQNDFHVREHTSQEFRVLLEKYFEQVELLNQKGEPIADDSVEPLVLAKCLYPRI